MPPYPSPPSPLTPTSTTPTSSVTHQQHHPHPGMAAAAAAAAAATLYGSSILPSICMQNVFLQYQRIMAECQNIGIGKLNSTTPNYPTVLASPAKSEKLEDEPHPLDLCTTNKMMNNNNKTNKAIWSPASSCEEENEMKAVVGGATNGFGLACQTCHRQFGSPTKLEIHCRKVHHQPQALASETTTTSTKANRRERVFKVTGNDYLVI